MICWNKCCLMSQETIMCHITKCNCQTSLLWYILPVSTHALTSHSISNHILCNKCICPLDWRCVVCPEPKYIHRVSKKTGPVTFTHNFNKTTILIPLILRILDIENLHLVLNLIKTLNKICVCSRVPAATITTATANSQQLFLTEITVT